jgi:hypothetical protein
MLKQPVLNLMCGWDFLVDNSSKRQAKVGCFLLAFQNLMYAKE